MSEQLTIRNLPFLASTVAVIPEMEKEFNDWYTNEYLPDLLAMAPSIEVCRRLRSLYQEPTLTTTVYSSSSIEELIKGMNMIKRPYRKIHADKRQEMLKYVIFNISSLMQPIYIRFKYMQGEHYPIS